MDCMQQQLTTSERIHQAADEWLTTANSEFDEMKSSYSAWSTQQTAERDAQKKEAVKVANMRKILDAQVEQVTNMFSKMAWAS